MAAYEEQQKLQKEDEASKTKAENGYDRLGHVELLIVTLQTQKYNWFSQSWKNPRIVCQVLKLRTVCPCLRSF